MRLFVTTEASRDGSTFTGRVRRERDPIGSTIVASHHGFPTRAAARRWGRACIRDLARDFNDEQVATGEIGG